MSLKSLRLKRGMTQDNLGVKTGLGRELISKYERGVKPIENMTLGTALRLCDALRVSNPRRLLDDDTPDKGE